MLYEYENVSDNDTLIADILLSSFFPQSTEDLESLLELLLPKEQLAIPKVHRNKHKDLKFNIIFKNISNAILFVLSNSILKTVLFNKEGFENKHQS